MQGDPAMTLKRSRAVEVEQMEVDGEKDEETERDS